jgi:hypothetical protein
MLTLLKTFRFPPREVIAGKLGDDLVFVKANAAPWWGLRRPFILNKSWWVQLVPVS